MTSEVEPENPEVWGVAAAQSASGSADADTLMEVTFQKNPSQKYKYLEAEPKILGVTEIALTVFFVVCRISFYMVRSELNGFMLAFSCVGIISGSVAIAAQKLHLPTLKACLGMQVVTCVAYTFCLLETFVEPYARITDCWHPYNHSNITHENDTCIQIEKGFHLLFALDQLTELTQIVLSITIAAYCCKVIPCCSPTSHVVSNAHFLYLSRLVSSMNDAQYYAQFSTVKHFLSFSACHRYDATHGYAMNVGVCASKKANNTNKTQSLNTLLNTNTLYHSQTYH
uniref:Si:ch211-212k18.8 n=1 Tax=Cyprinus carpio TaxID=7962 RepID=A0A8C1TY81_CYPCA